MSDDKKIYAPWEKQFGKMLTPFEEFVHNESSSGFLLIGATILAIVLANSFLADAYSHFFHTPIVISVGQHAIDHSLHHWINDGLMALFFFVVGLEIKREIVVGELRDPKKAALPISAAVGGMLVPAAVFYLFNMNTPETMAGWAIPMATDIAFAVGLLVLLGSRVPKGLAMFLVALAIVDDLGAVIVIALFYTAEIHMSALMTAFGFFFLMLIFNRLGMRRPLPYFLVGGAMWVAMLASGVHATIAGVLTALTIPVMPRIHPRHFSDYAQDLVNKFKNEPVQEQSPMTSEHQKSVLSQMEKTIHNVESPLSRLEHQLHLPVAMLIIPLFALANAGIPMTWDGIVTSMSAPLTLGIIAGLVLGKTLGITGFTWLAIKSGLATLPEGVRMAHVWGVAMLGGIGFTMSIFIAELAFTGQTLLLIEAKTGILFGSLVAAILGYVYLIKVGK